MKRYVIRRLLIALPTFLGITVLVFVVSYLSAGSPLELLLSNQNISAAEIARQGEKLGLNQPIYVQYFSWLGHLVLGNFGKSYRTMEAVTDMVFKGLGATSILVLVSVVIACLIAIPLGVQSARRQNKIWDHIAAVFSFLATSTPSFFIALVLLYVFSVQLKILPIGGMYKIGEENNLLSLLQHLIMPGLVLSFHMIGTLIQFTRSSMLEVMREDYVRTAKAKGLKERNVVVRHVLRNSLIPVVTYLGMEIPLMLGGAVVTEQVFSWPGIGKLMIQSIFSRDYPVVMGITVIVALAVLVFNIITDLIYGLLDPRIRYD
ncbi:peptide permease [Gordoniibacillus kamchatkensis]|uniref:Peptide permease n=1 Tax=Gordoniibacillus kamchatkensis TaxID=1590651 RepID=A0ABR5AAD2_9BACL|nr:ABC transporter permease [Paenibacillus sp. VKM B-2647]KIL37937.1 peptide permease [Paenibacillus sp. VKM B-2647]